MRTNNQNVHQFILVCGGFKGIALQVDFFEYSEATQLLTHTPKIKYLALILEIEACWGHISSMGI